MAWRPGVGWGTEPRGWECAGVAAVLSRPTLSPHWPAALVWVGQPVCAAGCRGDSLLCLSQRLLQLSWECRSPVGPLCAPYRVQGAAAVLQTGDCPHRGGDSGQAPTHSGLRVVI